MPPSMAMFRREIVDAVGGFQDPWGADDLDFYLRAALRSEAWCHQTVVTRYRRLTQLTEIFRDCLLENVKDRLYSGDAAGAQRASTLLAAESPQRWARLAGRWSTVD